MLQNIDHSKKINAYIWVLYILCAFTHSLHRRAPAEIRAKKSDTCDYSQLLDKGDRELVNTPGDCLFLGYSTD